MANPHNMGEQTQTNFVGIQFFTEVNYQTNSNAFFRLHFPTLKMESIRSSKASVLTRVTRRNIPEDVILHSHCRENLKPYTELTGWTV
jgi:hypothetical protein